MFRGIIAIAIEGMGVKVSIRFIYIDAIFSKAIILLVSRYLTDGDLKVPGGMGLLSIFTKHL